MLRILTPLAMRKLLGRVTDSFAIEGRGTILVLEDGWRIPRREKVYGRERIRIVHPDQSWVSTFIVSIEYLLRGDRSESPALMLPKDIAIEDAPKDPMIFLEREDEPPVLRAGEKTERGKPN